MLSVFVLGTVTILVLFNATHKAAVSVSRTDDSVQSNLMIRVAE